MTWARTRDPAAAEDLAQEILLACLEALRGGHVKSPEHLGAFVHGTARNLVNNYFRSRARRPVEVSLPDSLPCDPPADAVEEEERQGAIRDALSRLGERDRAILRMRFVDGLEAAKIASELGMRPDAVRARQSRAIKKLVRWIRSLSRTARVGPLHERRPSWTVGA